MAVIRLISIMPQVLLYLDAESLIRYGGVFIVCLLVFCSVGVFFCFFLPIGGILFTAGIFAATGDLVQHVFTICWLLILSSVAGSLAGYGLGCSTGNFFYTRKGSRFFRRKYLIATEEFYKKYGALTLIAGYFLPIIRTFAPVLAGIIRMKFQRFLLYTITGSVIFILVFVLTGYLIDSLPVLRSWLKYIVTFFILVVTIPLVIKIVREMRKPAKK
ncbi:DedA family protein [Terrimonas pollutisoli]|uniref:DedA family protein n=1 Tax=Terrimonas pollutisoli TaxID=3034147 RepID=UPI0023EAEF2E|nr:VTT domain-containing protein [Terrimonas sp. H1YJ31]